MNKARIMTNIGIAGEEIKPGLVKTVEIARNGIFETKDSSWVGGYVKKVSDYVLSTSNLIPEMEESFYMKKLELLPLKAFAAVYKFYKEVCDLNGNEAQINFYINEKNLETINVDGEDMVLKDIPGIDFWTDNIFSYVPIQKNSAALTTTTDPIYYALRAQTKAHIETHSHNTMSAFKSGTDEKNSDIEGLQLVFGRLNSSTTYDFKSWVTISGIQFDDVPYEELLKYIDLPYNIGDVQELLEAVEDFEVPTAWMDQCVFGGTRPVYAKPRRAWSWPSYSSSDEELQKAELEEHSEPDLAYGGRYWGQYYEELDKLEQDIEDEFWEFEDSYSTKYGYKDEEFDNLYEGDGSGYTPLSSSASPTRNFTQPQFSGEKRNTPEIGSLRTDDRELVSEERPKTWLEMLSKLFAK